MMRKECGGTINSKSVLGFRVTFCQLYMQVRGRGLSIKWLHTKIFPFIDSLQVKNATKDQTNELEAVLKDFNKLVRI